MPLPRPLKLAYKEALRRVPHGPKYAVMTAWHSRRPPFHLVRPGATVVQVGVAGWLCAAGRSQAIVFARLAGATGRVLGFEAIPENAALFRAYAERHGIANVEVRDTGLWNKKDVLRFDAPADGLGSARIKGVRPDKAYRFDAERELAVDTLDTLLAEAGIAHLDLVNITTNGAEAEILEGGMDSLRRFRPALCMPARDDSRRFFEATLRPLGYAAREDDVRLHPLGGTIRLLWAEAAREAGPAEGRAEGARV